VWSRAVRGGVRGRRDGEKSGSLRSAEINLEGKDKGKVGLSSQEFVQGGKERGWPRPRTGSGRKGRGGGGIVSVRGLAYLETEVACY